MKRIELVTIDMEAPCVLVSLRPARFFRIQPVLRSTHCSFSGKLTLPRSTRVLSSRNVATNCQQVQTESKLIRAVLTSGRLWNVTIAAVAVSELVINASICNVETS